VRKVITAAEMREVDRLTTERYALPSLLLMEQAAGASARAIAARLQHDLSGLQVLVLCGRGNNGGDGAALARLLWLAGASVDVVLFGRVEATAGDARTNVEIVRQLAEANLAVDVGAHAAWLSFKEFPTDASWWPNKSDAKVSYKVIVDAMFGTGLTRPLVGIYVKPS